MIIADDVVRVVRARASTPAGAAVFVVMMKAGRAPMTISLRYALRSHGCEQVQNRGRVIRIASMTPLLRKCIILRCLGEKRDGKHPKYMKKIFFGKRAFFESKRMLHHFRVFEGADASARPSGRLSGAPPT